MISIIYPNPLFGNYWTGFGIKPAKPSQHRKKKQIEKEELPFSSSSRFRHSSSRRPYSSSGGGGICGHTQDGERYLLEPSHAPYLPFSSMYEESFINQPFLKRPTEKKPFHRQTRVPCTRYLHTSTHFPDASTSSQTQQHVCAPSRAPNPKLTNSKQKP